MTAASIDHLPLRERRLEQRRRTVELILDTIFRPGNWAAQISERFGLQGRVQTNTIAVRPARRANVGDRPPLRLAFASDFHAGSTTHPRLLAEACDALTALQPDLLLLGGDFVSVRASYIHPLAERLAQVPAPLGKFAVLGNHDLRANWREIVSALERAGVSMITNTSVRLPAPYDDIVISGLDDPTRGLPRPDLAMDDVAGTDGMRIVLVHSPDGLTAIGDRHFDLALAGHTHGGQIGLPSGRAIFVPGGGLNRRYWQGRFDVGNGRPRTLLVSRGIGTSAIPARLFAAPEVHLCLIT